jgi:DNA-binding MarR family transcriptional regulator
MPLLMLKDMPRYECLLEAAQLFPDLDPSACEVFLQLLRTGDEVFGVESFFLASKGISQGRFTVLMLLTKPGRDLECAQQVSNPAELAERAGVTRATMTGLLDTLVKDGFVRREPAPNDRRMMSVSLTEEGQALMARILPGYFRRVAQMVKNLSEAERRTMVHLLTKIQQGVADGPATNPSLSRPSPVIL